MIAWTTPVAAVRSVLLPTLIDCDGRLRGESPAIFALLGFTALWTGPRGPADRPALSAGAALGPAVLAPALVVEAVLWCAILPRDAGRIIEPWRRL